MSDLAINLNRLREEKGLSQYQLVAELGIKRSAYSTMKQEFLFLGICIKDNSRVLQGRYKRINGEYKRALL